MPSNFHQEELNLETTRIHLQWQSASNVDYYEIKYGTEGSAILSSECPKTEQTKCTIHNLDPGRQYVCEITAVFKKQKSEKTTCKAITSNFSH